MADQSVIELRPTSELVLSGLLYKCCGDVSKGTGRTSPYVAEWLLLSEDTGEMFSVTKQDVSGLETQIDWIQWLYLDQGLQIDWPTARETMSTCAKERESCIGSRMY